MEIVLHSQGHIYHPQMYPRISPSKRFFSFMSSNQPSRAVHRLHLTQNHLRAQSSLANIDNVSVGAKYTQEYRNYAVDRQSNKVISYFHDIPLRLNTQQKTATMVVEVPRWSNGKFEIDPKQPGNPIVQDFKKGKVRFVRNLFPYHGYIHNYGALPQTWEDPTQKSNVEGLYGDGDPLDVCEIGSSVFPIGSVVTVKLLGSLALVDDGELDWKVIAINVDDELAPELNDIVDVEKKCPGLLAATRQWFKDYKKPDGKPENVFAFNGEYRDAAQTWETVEECHVAWEKLVTGKTEKGKFAIENVTLQGTPLKQDKFEFSDSVLLAAAEPDAPIPDEVHKSFHY